MRIKVFNDLQSFRNDIKEIGVDKCVVEKMASKGTFVAVHIKDIPTPAALILKQEMLARGAEAAIHRNVITGKLKNSNVLLYGSIRQLEKLTDNLKVQYFGLKTVGEDISAALSNLFAKRKGLKIKNRIFDREHSPYLMAVLNLTPDSFYDGGKYDKFDQAKKQIQNFIDSGADIIDVGGESSRPGSKKISVEKEKERVRPVLEFLSSKKIPVSIDSYKPSVVKMAIELGAAMVNDIFGLRKKGMAELVAEYNVPVVIMHLKGTPVNMQAKPVYKDVIDEILNFFETRITFAIKKGIKEKNIIIDPGIGFGKTLKHNIKILNNIDSFKALGFPLLIGHSRKSMLGMILDLPVEQRLNGTLAISSLLVIKGVDIIRVHDVRENREVIQVIGKLKGSSWL